MGFSLIVNYCLLIHCELSTNFLTIPDLSCIQDTTFLDPVFGMLIPSTLHNSTNFFARIVGILVQYENKQTNSEGIEKVH